MIQEYRSYGLLVHSWRHRGHYIWCESRHCLSASISSFLGRERLLSQWRVSETETTWPNGSGSKTLACHVIVIWGWGWGNIICIGLFLFSEYERDALESFCCHFGLSGDLWTLDRGQEHPKKIRSPKAEAHWWFWMFFSSSFTWRQH